MVCIWQVNRAKKENLFQVISLTLQQTGISYIYILYKHVCSMDYLDIILVELPHDYFVLMSLDQFEFGLCVYR